MSSIPRLISSRSKLNSKLSSLRWFLAFLLTSICAKANIHHGGFKQIATVTAVGSRDGDNCPPVLTDINVINLTLVKCSAYCLKDDKCDSFLYRGDTTPSCLTGKNLSPGAGKILQLNVSSKLYSMECLNAVSLPVSFTARSCQDWQAIGVRCNGFYTIYPDSVTAKIVYCDMRTDGGGWTVFQKRTNDSVDFNLKWADYKAGFGNEKNYWIGNDMLYELSKGQETELYVVMRDWDCITKYARYSTFWIMSEASNYKLRISGYNGTAGDAMYYNNDREFSTKDADHDSEGSDNCAITYHDGGWWFGFCTLAELNGRYMNGMVTSPRSIHWKTFHGGPRVSLESTMMMIRRKL